MLISDEFPAFDAYVLFAVEIDCNVIDRETSRTAASIDSYQSPMEKFA